MTVIDLDRIRKALPDRAKVTLGKTKSGSPFIECIVRWPGIYSKGTSEEEKIVEEVFEWQREIIGRDNISEFYTEETGSHWFVYLKRAPMEFINVSGDDINSFAHLEIIKDGKLNIPNQ